MRKLIAVAGMLFAASALAEDFKIATGSKTGTYSTMLTQVSKYCSSDDALKLVNVETSGSVENLQLLLDNQVNAAFVQEDVLFFKDKTDNIQGSVKTLLALYPEEVHFLGRAAPLKQTQEGKHFWNKDTTNEITLGSVEDLSNRKVGAAGGSYITEQLIRLQAEIPLSVTEFSNNAELKKALDSGQVDAAVFVGGQPLPLIGGDPNAKPPIPALGPDYKLLPLQPQSVDKLKNIYKLARLKYPKMTAASISSISTDSLLVTGNYKTPRMVSQLKALHDCILEHLADFQETTGFHAKWRQVDAANQGKWPSRYEFPAVVSTDGRKTKKK